MKVWAGYLLASFLVGFWSAVNADATGKTVVLLIFDSLTFDLCRETEAFDFVDHDQILKKFQDLYMIKGRLLEFKKNYVCGRTQSVVIENCQSSSKPVLSGILQGFILPSWGPYSMFCS